jgi:GTPase SAR1 family protein
MKPSQIFDVLDIAHNATKQGKVFNILFSGDAGLGKSSVIQQWCKSKNLPFIDLRGAYLEAPDVIGFPQITTKDGKHVTTHNLPEFWPTKDEGVLLIEEPNRATTAVLNTFMQLLTDRKIHMYDFPPGWMIVGAINPENEHYDVNTMDTALKNRFVIIDVEYDKKTFIKYMKDNKWNNSIVTFIDSNSWVYTKPDQIANNPGSKFVSPRTWHQIETALSCGIPHDLQLDIFNSILGKNIGKSFWAWINDEKPVLHKDLIKNPKAALSTLKAFSDPNNYKNSQISITITDIVENKEMEDDLLAKVILALPADQGPVLMKELEFVRKDYQLVTRICKEYPEVKKYLKDTLSSK